MVYPIHPESRSSNLHPKVLAPNMAISGLVHRSKPNTHNFHLRCGEMTINLEKFAMTMGLSIGRVDVTRRVDSGGATTLQNPPVLALTRCIWKK